MGGITAKKTHNELARTVKSRRSGGECGDNQQNDESDNGYKLSVGNNKLEMVQRYLMVHLPTIGSQHLGKVNQKKLNDN